MIVVASVHHTGTNFVGQEILKGFSNAGMGYRAYVKGVPTGKKQVRIHCELAHVDYLEWWCSKYPSIVPMRHPVKVFESWKVREKSFKNLAGQYDILKNIVSNFDTTYLPIDVPDRDDWLWQLNERFGLDIQTTWPVIMSRKETATLTDLELDLVRAVMSDGFFDRFGYEV